MKLFSQITRPLIALGLKVRSRKSLIEDASDLRTSLFAISLIFGTEAAISIPVIATTNSVSVSENPRESLGLNW